MELYQDTLKKHDIPNSDMCLGGDWAKGANKAFVVVGGDALALLGDIATIGNARKNLHPLPGKSEMNAS